MTNKLTEYKQQPVLSQRASEFVETFEGGEVPNDIRAELEKFVKDSAPFVEQFRTEIEKQFERVFKQ